MKSVIFLNKYQKQILDEAKIGVGQLSDEVLREVLTATDYREIRNTTDALMANNGLLNRLGFEPNYPTSGIVSDDTIDSKYVEKSPTEVVVDAYCKNEDSIVLWETGEGNNSYSMFKESSINIIKALSAVKQFNALMRTKQFKICFLNY